jgi:hypothetical protein
MIVLEERVPLEVKDRGDMKLFELLCKMQQKEKQSDIIGVVFGRGRGGEDGLAYECFLHMEGDFIVEAVEFDLFGEEDEFNSVDAHPWEVGVQGAELFELGFVGMECFPHQAVQVQLDRLFQGLEHRLGLVVLVHPAFQFEVLPAHSHHADLDLLLVLKPAPYAFEHSEDVVFVFVSHQQLKHFVVLEEVKTLELDAFLL